LPGPGDSPQSGAGLHGHLPVPAPPRVLQRSDHRAGSDYPAASPVPWNIGHLPEPQLPSYKVGLETALLPGRWRITRAHAVRHRPQEVLPVSSGPCLFCPGWGEWAPQAHFTDGLIATMMPHVPGACTQPHIIVTTSLRCKCCHGPYPTEGGCATGRSCTSQLHDPGDRGSEWGLCPRAQAWSSSQTPHCPDTY
jgi:hypothetical protein